MYIVHRMEENCVSGHVTSNWITSQYSTSTTKMSTRKLNAPVQYRLVQRKERKSHLTKRAPLRGTQPKYYSDCSSVSFMGSLMFLYTTGITATACKTKLTWVAIWIGAPWCNAVWAEICSLSHYKETLTVRSAKRIKHNPDLQREQHLNAIPMDCHLFDRMWFLYLTLETK